MHFWPGMKYHKFAFRSIWSSTKLSQAACDRLPLIFCFPSTLHHHSPLLAHLHMDILKAEEIKCIQNTSKQHILLGKKMSLQNDYRFQFRFTWFVLVLSSDADVDGTSLGYFHSTAMKKRTVAIISQLSCEHRLIKPNSCYWPVIFTFTLQCFYGWSSLFSANPVAQSSSSRCLF